MRFEHSERVCFPYCRWQLVRYPGKSRVQVNAGFTDIQVNAGIHLQEGVLHANKNGKIVFIRTPNYPWSRGAFCPITLLLHETSANHGSILHFEFRRFSLPSGNGEKFFRQGQGRSVGCVNTPYTPHLEITINIKIIQRLFLHFFVPSFRFVISFRRLQRATESCCKDGFSR